ncbi:ATPase central domain protein, partial [mine drainage metagenome]
MAVHLSGRPVAKNLDLDEIARKTERFSGADLANLVREAATIAVRRMMVSGQVTPIRQEDFLEVLPRMKPSISMRVIAEYETMKLDYERKMHQTHRTERRVLVRWDESAVSRTSRVRSASTWNCPLTRPSSWRATASSR